MYVSMCPGLWRLWDLVIAVQPLLSTSAGMLVMSEVKHQPNFSIHALVWMINSPSLFPAAGAGSIEIAKLSPSLTATGPLRPLTLHSLATTFDIAAALRNND